MNRTNTVEAGHWDRGWELDLAGLGLTQSRSPRTRAAWRLAIRSRSTTHRGDDAIATRKALHKTSQGRRGWLTRRGRVDPYPNTSKRRDSPPSLTDSEVHIVSVRSMVPFAMVNGYFCISSNRLITSECEIQRARKIPGLSPSPFGPNEVG